jgi:hypothetical protein
MVGAQQSTAFIDESFFSRWHCRASGCASARIRSTAFSTLDRWSFEPQELLCDEQVDQSLDGKFPS